MKVTRVQPNCETLKPMARAVVKYAFAALLALLSTQALVPSERLVATIGVLCAIPLEDKTETENPRDARRIQVGPQVLQRARVYVSWIGSESDIDVLFRRPRLLALLVVETAERRFCVY